MLENNLAKFVTRHKRWHNSDERSDICLNVYLASDKLSALDDSECRTETVYGHIVMSGLLIRRYGKDVRQKVEQGRNQTWRRRISRGLIITGQASLVSTASWAKSCPEVAPKR